MMDPPLSSLPSAWVLPCVEPTLAPVSRPVRLVVCTMHSCLLWCEHKMLVTTDGGEETFSGDPAELGADPGGDIHLAEQPEEGHSLRFLFDVFA